MKFIAGLLGGIILAILGAILVTTTFAASPQKGGSWGAIAFFIFWTIGFVVALSAKNAPKAWRRLLLSSAVLSFLAPISGIIYTGSFMATRVDATNEYAGAQVAGAAIGGGLISGFMGFVGFFLGVVFLIIGFLVGRDKQVVYVEKQSQGQQALPLAPSIRLANSERSCPWCAETILVAAKICKHCGREVEQPVSEQPVSEQAERLRARLEALAQARNNN